VDVVDTLLSPGLLELPFSLLHNLETPAIIRIVMKQADNLETTTTCTPEFCPYTGFRRDMVAVTKESMSKMVGKKMGFCLCRDSVLLTKITHI
jgi:hypothetical protein